MRRVVLVVVAVVACSSRTPDHAAAQAPADARVVIVADTATPDAVVACAVGSRLDNGACTKDADCVLTDLPSACGACNLDRPYPALRTAFDERSARCTGVAECTTGCPPHDTYTPAFYRAECRKNRCIAWRYHGGG